MPLSVADHIEIHELLARYNHALDSGDAAAWASTFVADGAFTAGGRTRTGAQELQAFVTDFATHMPRSRHFTNNVIINGDGDEATSRCYLMLVDTGNATPTLSTVGTYEDTLRRVDGAWRFVSRTIVRD